MPSVQHAKTAETQIMKLMKQQTQKSDCLHYQVQTATTDNNYQCQPKEKRICAEYVHIFFFK